MAVTKASFMARPKIKSLPGAEKERRWKQHLMSEGGIRDRRRPTVSGKGNYFLDAMRAIDNRILKRLPKGSFQSAGSALGGYLGAPQLGGAAGNLLSQITGRGNYKVNTNSIIEGDDLKPSQLSFSSSGAAAVRLRKREYIGSVVAPEEPSAFTTTTYRLQSTDQTTFPWLAEIAGHFTEWQLQGCVFSFETSSSNYAANMALGTIALGTKYNSNERQFRNMEEILQSPYHTRGNPSESLMHGIECDPTLQVSERLFTRRPGCEGPPNLYDHGVVTIATEGLPASSGTILGRLFVTYDIELSLPVLPNVTLASGMSSIFSTNAIATTGPAFGGALNMVHKAGQLMLGGGVEDNIVVLNESNGPHVKPDTSNEADLIAWISDSSTVPGGQYYTFARAGSYNISVTFSSSDMSIVPASWHAFIGVQPVTPHLQVTGVDWDISPSLSAFGSYYQAAVYTAVITTTYDEQSVLFTRQNPYPVQSIINLVVASR